MVISQSESMVCTGLYEAKAAESSALRHRHHWPPKRGLRAPAARAGRGRSDGCLRAARAQPGAWHAAVAHGGAAGGRVFLPHSPDLGELLRGAREAGLLDPAAPLDVPQFAVGLLSVTGGLVPQVLAALGVRPTAVRAAVAEIGEPGGA